MRRAGLVALETNSAVREAAVVARLAKGFDDEELRTARTVVVALRDRLADNR